MTIRVEHQAGPMRLSGVRTLIVNADDLGMSVPVTDGVLVAWDRGVVTSASLMVLRGDAHRAAALGRGRPGLTLGLHIELGEWRLEGGSWVCVRPVVDLTSSCAVAREVDRQLDRFLELTGRAPTHLDSHQHVHLQHPIPRRVVRERASRLGIPARGLDPRIGTCGGFFAMDAHGATHRDWVSTTALLRLISELPEGVTELACHPGLAHTEDVYGPERALELKTLTDPLASRFLQDQGIRLESFLSFGRRGA